MPLQLGTELVVEVEKLAVGGNGVARADGFVVFVRESAPGDRVLVRIVDSKKNFAEAEILEVIRASPSRIKPLCPVFGRCGGCDWQHIDYPTQLLQKNLIVNETLARTAGLSDINVLPINSSQPWRYRNRVQLHVRGDQVGFLRKRSHELVATDDCLITDEKITAEFSHLRHHKENRIELELGRDGKVHQEMQTGEPRFAQVNSQQNDFMVSWVLAQLAACESNSPGDIVDLYSGQGNFALPIAMAQGSHKVIGVELSRANVESARRRAEVLGLINVIFYDRDVVTFLKSQHGPAPHWMIIDPPRAGAGPEVVKEILRWKPQNLVYISCDVVTLARDLKLLKENYDLQVVQPVDMFPQTAHIEVITKLRCRAHSPSSRT